MNCARSKPPTNNVSCVMIERPRDYRFRHPPIPNRERLLFVKKGSVTVRSNGAAVIANQGEFISISSGLETVTEYIGDENCIIILLFSGVLDNDKVGVRSYNANYEAAALMRSALDNTGSTAYLLPAILYGVLHHLTLNDKTRREGCVNSVIRYINDHYSENLRIAEYAAMAYVSESHFRKLFSAATGMSPIEYRNSIRLKIARELISEGYTVSEAAEAVGFNSTSFYCRMVAARRRKL